MDVVFDKICEWAKTPREDVPYSNAQLLAHKKIWNVLKFDKQGLPKEHSFVNWCRRIARHRTESAAKNVAATEHDDRFKKLVKNIFANELTPEQKQDPKYQLREGRSITTIQRSLVTVILRKNLGDHRIAEYILDYDIPTVLKRTPTSSPAKEQTPSTPMQPSSSAVQSDAATEHIQIQSALEELMMWYAGLLQWLVKRQNDPNTIIAQKLSDLDQKQWQTERRQRKLELKSQLHQGANSAELRDSNRKRFHDMSATEQRVLEEYDCGILQKRLDEIRVRKPKIAWTPPPCRQAKPEPSFPEEAGAQSIPSSSSRDVPATEQNKLRVKEELTPEEIARGDSQRDLWWKEKVCNGSEAEFNIMWNKETSTPCLTAEASESEAEDMD